MNEYTAFRYNPETKRIDRTTVTATPARWLTLYDPETRDFVVIRNERVIDHVSTYLEAEDLKNEYEAALALLETRP